MTRFNYTLGDKSLQETDNHPYLGVHITKDLTWNKHIHQITSTTIRTIAFARRNLYSCPQHIKQSAYTTLVRPLLEYSSSVWDPHTKTLVNKIEMVQRRAARFCHNDYKTIEKGCVSEMTSLPPDSIAAIVYLLDFLEQPSASFNPFRTLLLVS